MYYVCSYTSLKAEQSLLNFCFSLSPCLSGRNPNISSLKNRNQIIYLQYFQSLMHTI